MRLKLTCTDWMCVATYTDSIHSGYESPHTHHMDTHIIRKHSLLETSLKHTQYTPGTLDDSIDNTPQDYINFKPFTWKTQARKYIILWRTPHKICDSNSANMAY